MAKNMQPIAKRCKALGISPAEMGYAKKTTNRNPGGQMRKKKSEYGLQLAEKQKVIPPAATTWSLPTPQAACTTSPT